ncbi:VIT domain-containing protein [Alteriqipengyuania sp. WL0013]|uniref:VIT domain-containing protein n=1 Tax=Alteriqipengyuania sp. WL0013 TaxID=3110773 RepID=UPI002BA4FD72|nr:VIT domain-containing protein [Alteriqipengyuania sp. WL0013]MEB3415143.1 VIT domain-containing protein [Alteriqipengyuania sp. WL0013]
MRRFVSLVSLMAIAGSLPIMASAQDQRASPALSARVDGVVGEDSKQLQIASLDIEVTRRGGLAMTEMTVRFENPGNETLEGEFGLTLPEGSVVTGYALDVGGEMIDGVLQSRDRAREAFERRVVRRIDPGLAEVDYSDRFESRVYPIFPRQGRTIRIRFSSPLDANGEYILPLDSGQVGAITMRVRGVDSAPGRDFAWTQDGGAWVYRAGAGEVEGTIRFTAEPADGLTLSQHPGEGQFFELTGDLPPAPEAGRDNLVIMWDRSVSRLDDELKREAELVERLARRLDARKVTIQLFDSRGDEAIEVDARNVADTLKAVRYAGGTSYEYLATPIRDTSGTCVVFSDGRATIGQRRGLGGTPCRVSFVTSGGEADKPWLEAEARRMGGAFLDLSAVNDDKAIDLLMSPSAIPLVTDGEKVAIETRSLPAGEGRYRLVGPMPTDGRLQVNGRMIPVNRMAVPNFAAPGALWAAQRLATVRDSMTIEELAEEARRWSVATPGVSFIVLETPEDYVESGFTPPETYPKALRQQFDAIKRQRAEFDARRDRAFYENIVAMWEQRKEWWETGKAPADMGNPGVPPPPVPVAMVEEAAMDERRAPPPPAPPPPPPPPPARMAPPPPVAPPPPQDASNIIVTGGARTQSAVERVTTVDVAEPEAEFGFRQATANGVEYAEDGAIETAEWAADRPYIAAWDAAGDNWADAVADTAKENGDLPLFYLDLAEWHWSNGRKQEALRAAEAALELPARDNQTLFIVAQRLLRYGDPDRAIWLLEQLVEREAERPHPLLALADAYAKRGRAMNNRANLQKSLQLFVDAGMKRWPDEYGRVNEYALAEANAIIVALGGRDLGVALDDKFIAALPLDMRVVVQWNTPRTDLDLWVRQPDGQEIGYSNRTSKEGARYLHDVTQGYGPEEFMIRKAPDGTYRIELDTYAADRRNPNGPSTATVRIIRNFATPQQSEELIDVEMLPSEDGRRLVGTVEID